MDESDSKEEIIYDLKRPDKVTLTILVGLLFALCLLILWSKVVSVGSGMLGEEGDSI